MLSAGEEERGDRRSGNRWSKRISIYLYPVGVRGDVQDMDLFDHRSGFLMVPGQSPTGVCRPRRSFEY